MPITSYSEVIRARRHTQQAPLSTPYCIQYSVHWTQPAQSGVYLLPYGPTYTPANRTSLAQSLGPLIGAASASHFQQPTIWRTNLHKSFPPWTAFTLPIRL